MTSVRRALFPIEAHEVHKFLSIGFIKFFVVLALTLTRDGKDAMVVAECGAESIAFLKVRRDEKGGDEKIQTRALFSCIFFFVYLPSDPLLVRKKKKLIFIDESTASDANMNDDSILTDIRRIAGGDVIHRRIFQNVIDIRTEDSILRHVRSVLRILLRIR